MAEEKNYINLSIDKLEEYIEKKYADVLASYPLGVMEVRKGIVLTTLEDGSLYLDTLNIRTAAQGQGKGKEVLNILKNWADANKIAIYIKPAYLPDNPTFKGIETTPEKQVENLFNYYKNNGWEDNPNFTSLSPNEQSAQLSLSARAEWGATTDDLYSPLVYTPEGVDIPELPKNPYINDIISTAEKFNIDGKAFVDGYNQPILDETIQGILKIEPFFGLSGYDLEVDEWKKSEFSKISDILVEQGIDPSDIEDISKYIPRDKILTPAQIFQGNMRNEYFTDEIVEMLKKDLGGFFELDDAGDELFPQNRPKRNHRLYYIISQGDDVGGKLYADFVEDISGAMNKNPEPTKWVEYAIYGERTVDIPDTPGGSLGAAKLNDPLVFDSWIDNYTKTTTSFVDNLPLSTTVKNQFNKLVQGRAKNLATTGGVADAVDVWELGVLGLMIAAVAYKEYDEIPTILTNKAVDMFNSMTASYGIPPVQKEQYNLDYEFINKVVETGEKFMPTDIIIKKVGDVVKGAAETGAVTGFGYVPPNLTKTDTMETTQKIQPGVQEEKMFEQAKPKKSKATGGAGVKIL